MATRVLLTGAGGQLGTDVVLAAPAHTGIELHPFDRASLDVTDDAQVNKIVESVHPDVILHAGAYTAVDDCESNESQATAVNAEGTKNLVAAVSQSGARVIYVSTDYVFDGTKADPYLEADMPNPASVYGRSKLAGEDSVLAMGDAGLVVRTSWVCGAHGANMVKTILRLMGSHADLRRRPSRQADLHRRPRSDTAHPRHPWRQWGHARNQRRGRVLVRVLSRGTHRRRRRPRSGQALRHA